MSSIVFNAAIGGTDTSDATATAGDILSGKTAYADGEKLTGTISSKAAQTYNVSSGNQTIAAGQYLSGAQTIRAVSTTNITSANIKAGVTVKVGDSGNTGRIKNVTGKSSVVETEDATAVAADMLSGKTAYVNGAKVTGSIQSKAAQTYTPTTADQEISAGQYLSGAQTVKGDADLKPENIKSGVDVFGVEGTFTSDADATAGEMLSGKTAYVNGSKVTGNIPSKAAATYNVSSSNQTIAAGQYLSGAQTIRAVTTANITAANIKAGVTVKVGDAGNTGRIKNVTGKSSVVETDDATAVAGEILSGKTAYVDGEKVTGTIPSKSAQTYTPTTADQEISAGQYLSGTQTVKGDANLKADNIKAGTTIFGVAGTFTGSGYEIPEYAVSFLGMGDFTVKSNTASKTWDGNMEYSTDGKAWQTWSGAQISSKNGFLALRGTGNTFLTNKSITQWFIFTGAPFFCGGSIETLLDWQAVAAGNHPTMADNAFVSLFYSSEQIITAPSLPATNLTNGCYMNMFAGCKNLIASPALPATALTSQCYQNMFGGCLSIKVAPELPALTIKSSCYRDMFNSCLSLTTPPTLRATTLFSYCYYAMFAYCTSLDKIPSLPATTLATNCYQSMFKGCVNIKLSQTNTGDYTTAYRIPTTGTGTTGTGSLTDMFSGTGGTFTGTPSINTTYYTENTIIT